MDTPSDPSTTLSPTHAIVLAGGRGRRLHRATAALAERREKQFCHFGGERSLLQQTVDRLAPLAPPSRVSVVVRSDHESIARDQLSTYEGIRVLAQPCDRGTGVAVLAGILDAIRRAPGTTVVISPADHAFDDDDAVVDALRQANALARRRRAAVLIGAEPDTPRSDYGWIVPHPRRPGRVAAFVEKPPPSVAVSLMARGAVFNTMLMVAPAASLLRAFARLHPSALGRLLPAAFVEGDVSRQLLRSAYDAIDSIDFSRDVVGHLDDLEVHELPARVQWTDLGDEARLARWLEARAPAMARRVRAVLDAPEAPRS